MIKRFCDVCSDEIDKRSLYAKVYVIGECGVDMVKDSHITCLNSDNMRNWLKLSSVGKLEVVGMNEGD